MANPRLVILYLRSRGVPHAVPGLVVLLVLTGWNAPWLAWVQGTVISFVAMLAAALLGGGFGSPSSELDAAAPLRWWRWRTVHVLTGLVLCALPLSATVAYGETVFDLTVMRNVLGFGGLAFLTAVTAGARLSWTAPFVYALVAWRIPPQTSPWAQVWRWPVLPGDVDLSWWPAFGLCVLGTSLLTVRGAASQPG